jgi:SAM-dependent methyltransferase
VERDDERRAGLDGLRALGDAVDPLASEGFGRSATAYARARPSYPEAAVDWLCSQLALAPGRSVVDVAAGTGKLTAALVGSGARVLAVEPVAEMRAQLVEAAPDAEALEGTAEALPLAGRSVDAVTAGQAFCWFDPPRALAEFHRVLRPAGRLGLIWNLWDLDDPLQAELDAIVSTALGPDPAITHDTTASFQGVEWRALIPATELFGPVEERRFTHIQRLPARSLRDRIASVSFVAAAAEPVREAVLGRVDELARRQRETVALDYVTVAWVSSRAR